MPDVNINEIISRPGAERGILSIVLHDRDKIIECETQNLYADHFSVPGHQYLYSAICYLSGNPEVQNIDSLLIYNTVTDNVAKAAIDSLGGMSYIDSLIHSRVADNLRHYINDVRTCALKRMAYSLGSDIQSYVVEHGEDTTVEELITDIQNRTLNLVLSSESEVEVYRFGSDTERRLRERAENPQRIPGYTLGWEKYDAITQGYKKNELTVFVAESKTGKSTLLLNHAYVFSIINGIPGLYVDTEMTDEEQEDRMLSIISGVPYEEIFNGMYARDTIYGLGVEKTQRVQEATRKLLSSNLFHIYMPDFTIDKVTALTRKFQIQHRIGYLIFDYIKLPTSEIAGLANAQEYQRLGFITTCLKDIAGLCAIPVITAAQSNRTAIGNTNQDANSIGGSYRILQMATRLCFLRNKTDFELANEGFSQGNQKLKVAFQRNGASGGEEINVAFDRPILKMREIS